MIGDMGDNLGFVLGVPRSGTTLLSIMLGRHPQVLCPPEPWLFIALNALGDVHPQHPADPQLVGSGMKSFVDGHALDSARAYAKDLYNRKLAESGKTFFIDKTPRYHLILPYLRELLPASKRIVLLRNPLDVAASYKTSWLYDIPALLRSEPAHRACIDLIVGLRKLAAETRQPDVLTLHYEALVAEPEPHMARTLEFLGLPPAEGLTHFDLHGTQYEQSTMGDRKILTTTSPHMQSIDTWEKAFSPEDLQLLLDALGVEFLNELGYAKTVERLAALGIRPGAADAPATWLVRVQSGLDERLRRIEETSSYGEGLRSDANFAHETHAAFLALKAELDAARDDIARAREEADRAADQHRRDRESVEAALRQERQEIEQLSTEMRQSQEKCIRLDIELKQSRGQTAETGNEVARLKKSLDLYEPVTPEAPPEPKITPISATNSGDAYQKICSDDAIVLLIGNPPPAFVDAARRAKSIQIYSVGADRDTRIAAGIEQHFLSFIGTLAQFHKEIPIVPTAVVIEGVLDANLASLAQWLAPGTPVLCGSVADPAAAAGFEAPVQLDGATMLRASRNNTSHPRGLPERIFQEQRRLLNDHYANPPQGAINSMPHTWLSRRVFQPPSDPRAGGIGKWPFARAEAKPLPPTLPDGAPWPKISIVTPSYNQGRYIEETILSVLNQGYPNVEYIVTDGNSTDETKAILAYYRPRLAHAISEKDRGQSDAINKGMRLTTGEIVTWLNSDDMLAPGALAGMAIAFHTSKADMVAGVCVIRRDGSDKILNRHVTACRDGRLPLDDLLDIDGCWQRGQFFYQPEVMFTRALWERAGGHVDASLFYSMDYELWLRFAEAGARLHVIGRPIALFRVHEQQKTASDFQPELRATRDAFVKRTGRAQSPSRKVDADKAKLRIVFFSDLGSICGAGIAHQRLATAAALGGNEVFHVGMAPHLLTSQLSNEAIIAQIAERRPDVVIAGNTHGASLDPGLLGAISRRFPTAHVLHDLWQLTGRCAYTGDCTKYLTGCDQSCPTSTEYPPLEPSKIRGHWEAKDLTLTAGDAHTPILVGASSWTERIARERFASTSTPPRVIGFRFGMPLDVFRPRPRDICRDILELPRDRFIILFSSSQLSDKRKGLDHLLQALDILKLPNLLAVCVGRFDIGPRTTGATEFRSIGYVDDPDTLATVYSAADLYVGPSLIETFGQVFIEAAACGTPSIGYPTGGVSDALADGLSGRLAKRVDPAALAEAIKELYDDPELRRRMGSWGRLWAENQWSYHSSYQRMFAELNAAGVMRAIGAPPHVGFEDQPLRLHPVEYLEYAPPASPSDLEHASANGNGAANGSSVMPMTNGLYADIKMRLSRAESERDQLRETLERVSNTRLWSAIERSRDAFAAVIHSKYMPHGVSKRILGAGRWLAGGFERTGR